MLFENAIKFKTNYQKMQRKIDHVSLLLNLMIVTGYFRTF